MKKAFTYLFLLIFYRGLAQTELIPYNNTTIHGYQFQTLESDTFLPESVFPIYLPSAPIQKSNKSKFMHWLMNKDFISASDSATFYVKVNPIIYFEKMKASTPQAAGSLSRNTRGINIQAGLGQKIFIFSSFTENQAFLPDYQSQFVNTYLVVPGEGRTKTFKTTGFDYAQAQGKIVFLPYNFWNITFGSGKNFIGNGYRSFLLSDNSFSYPMLHQKFSFFNKQITYHVMNAWMQNIDRVPAHTTTEAIFKRKNAIFHYLSFNLTKKLEVSLFDATVIPMWDSLGTKKNEFAFYQPLPVVNFFSKKNGHVLGLNVNSKLFSNAFLYGQVVLDQDKRKGYQLGGKYFIKYKNGYIQFQAEVNHAEPYLYLSNNVLSNYSHYNQPLANPRGSGFNEKIWMSSFYYKRIGLELKYMYTNFYTDTTGYRIGSDLIFSENKNTPINTHLSKANKQVIAQAEIFYQLNNAYKLQLFSGFFSRIDYNFALNNKLNYVFFGIRTRIYHQYFDI